MWDWLTANYSPTVLVSAWGAVVVGYAAFAVLERFFPANRRPSIRELGADIRINLTFLLLNPVAVLLGGLWSNTAVAYLGGPRFHLNLTPWGANPVYAFLLAFVPFFVFDFFYYWFHRCQHEWSWLWQEHRLHHTERALNVTTNFRHHWLEEFLRAFFIFLPMNWIVSITPTSSLVAAVVIRQWSSFFHANIRVGLGPLKGVVVGPQYHRIHHSIEPEHIGKNYAAFFPIWDRSFGTYCKPKRGEWPATGLPGATGVSGFGEIVSSPFVRWWRGLTGRAMDGDEVTQLPVDANLTPLLGEFAWHSVTLDPTIEQVSDAHYELVAGIFNKYGLECSGATQILEVGAYAHITGYQLHEKFGVHVELFDLSANNLRLGRQTAEQRGLPVDGVDRTAGDFHELPFEDGQFDLVYMSSSLHHTWRWNRVLSEMIRVLAPGGIMFLENEPCRREFCFNKFRTNRQDSFTPFEKKLEDLGIIRTVAEAYLGSRLETSFQMVENQNIPLQELIAAVRSCCSILDLQLQPADCMGWLEHEMVQRAKQPSADVGKWLSDTLSNSVEQARPMWSANDRGLGFSLPTSTEIRSLSTQTARSLKRLPADNDSPEYIQALSDIFGASVRILAQKHGKKQKAAQGLLLTTHPEVENVRIAFPQETARLLQPGTLLTPDTQTADPEELEKIFPPSEWRMEGMPNTLRVVVPVVALPHIDLPSSKAHRILVLLRLYAVYSECPYTVTLENGTRELGRLSIFQTGSVLLSGIVERGEVSTAVRLNLKTKPLGPGSVPVGSVRVGYLGALMM
jgi:sterol desaturase/sphingolipid hydroxylase (fatty acid hydroxylase superfamily)/ubiquinone/menaquinone biosynthesis C-methylase UbiE